jgi:hypothetical protein
MSVYPLPGNTNFNEDRNPAGQGLAVFNAICADYAGGMSPTNPAVNNWNALNTAVQVATTYGGGLILIPNGTYKINGTITISNNFTDAPIIITGTSGGTTLIQTGSVDTFVVKNLGGSSRGVRFQDLQIVYDTSGSLPSGVAVNVQGCENVSCEHMLFYNCPQAASFDSTSISGGMNGCMVNYQVGSNNATMVLFKGPEQYARDCVLQQAVPGSQGAPTGCTGITMSDSTDNAYVTNTQILNFDYGIQLLNGTIFANRPMLSNVACVSSTHAVWIYPDKQVFQAYFKDCIFSLTQNGNQTSAGVLIDANGGNVSDILFENCMCYGWGGAGIKINTGRDIVINGGRFGSCALGVSSSGGIAITGPATNVTIDGADCSGTVSGLSQQPYGVSITGKATNVYVHNCNLTGNATGALLVSNTVKTLEVTQCAGYNDAGTVVSNVPPVSMTQFWNYSFGYYGPVEFYTPGFQVNSITIDSVNTQLTSGTFTLSPGESGVVNYNGPELVFLMIGQ